MDDFSRPPEERPADAEGSRHRSECQHAHHGGADPRQVALGQVRERGEEVIRHDETEHGVAEELEAFVRRLRG